MKQTFLLVLIVFSLSSCATAQDISPIDYKKKQIIFGNGGGFTGMVNTYVLLQNGRLYQQKSDTTYSELSIVNKKECKTVFKKYKKAQSDTVHVNNPGNIYYFMEFVGKDTTHRVVWGGGGETPPDTVKAFHKELMEMVKVAKTEKTEEPK